MTLYLFSPNMTQNMTFPTNLQKYAPQKFSYEKQILELMDYQLQYPF